MKKDGNCPWIMRPELVTAYEKVFGREEGEFVYQGELTGKDPTSFSEGAVRQVYVNRYERNSRARRICIAHHGSLCVVCGFDFEKIYGPVGKNKIHVHHLKPLSEIKAEYKIDPIEDLRPVCPNCHLIIHSRKDPFTIDELKQMLRK